MLELTATEIIINSAPRPVAQEFLLQLFDELSAEGKRKAFPILLRACGLADKAAELEAANVS